MKKPSRRYTLRLREVYSVCIDDLVERGIFMEAQDCVRAGLRLLFEKYGLEPFTIPETEPETIPEKEG